MQIKKGNTENTRNEACDACRYLAPSETKACEPAEMSCYSWPPSQPLQVQPLFSHPGAAHVDVQNTWSGCIMWPRRISPQAWPVFDPSWRASWLLQRLPNICSQSEAGLTQLTSRRVAPVQALQIMGRSVFEENIQLIRFVLYVFKDSFYCFYFKIDLRFQSSRFRSQHTFQRHLK